MGSELATRRLILARPLLADAPALVAFMGDPEAMRHTLRFDSLRACRRHLAGHACQARRTGYGPWTIRERSGGGIVGLGGLYVDPFDPGWGVEIGYHFAPSAWGRGYASELTRFCLERAHGALGLAAVRAFAHPDNAASLRVLGKAGFRRERFVPEMNRLLFVHGE
jgi:RimJ/RimL family protein N-acetyltransferase